MNFPRGKLTPEDKGELEVAITVKQATVIVEFPYPVKWFGLGYNECRGLAELLLKRAEEIKQ